MFGMYEQLPDVRARLQDDGATECSIGSTRLPRARDAQRNAGTTGKKSRILFVLKHN